jgi:hypothetical protein
MEALIVSQADPITPSLQEISSRGSVDPSRREDVIVKDRRTKGLSGKTTHLALLADRKEWAEMSRKGRSMLEMC